MIADLFWHVASSGPVLGILGLLLLLCLVVGWLPFAKYIPVIGPEVLPARLVALLVALLLAFLAGVRVADQRATLDNLKAALAVQSADLDIASKSAADANARAAKIEQAANDQKKADDDYIASLKSSPACLLDDSDIRALERMRGGPAK
jgi:mannitol-specific phosphotransferase system IIBC component